MAESYLNKKVEAAVITVPAFFTEAQRTATKTAAEAAGLEVLRLLSEPMAAAMSYGLFVAGSKTVAIVDMGGGTFDVSILRIVDGGKFEAVALGGDNRLGGHDVDTLLMHLVCDKEERKFDDLSPSELQNLRTDVEKAKITLSTEDTAWVTDTLTISRADLESVVQKLRERIAKVIRGTLKDAKMQPNQVDEVVMVGLSTKMPWVRDLVKSKFKASELCFNVKADRAVSQGAAIQAAIMCGADRYTLSKVLMLDALPYSIGLETGSGKFAVVLPRNSKIPCSQTRTFTTHSDYQRAITVDIFEGEAELARENRWMDCIDFSVDGGSRLKAGEATILVTFSVDANGALLVNAESKSGPRSPAKLGSQKTKTLGNAQQGGPREDTEVDTRYLVAAIIVLIAMYIGARLHFAEELFDASEYNR
mmetsp:Transcript_608/g.885  ORF Transcript_608/g.885 Transcript_608/m.885 type:complete len:420 (+) Transcript_608:2-1261(+)